MTNNVRKLIKTRKIQSKVKIGSGDYLEAELIGDHRGITKKKNGNKNSNHLDQHKIHTIAFLQPRQSYKCIKLRFQTKWQSG